MSDRRIGDRPDDLGRTVMAGHEWTSGAIIAMAGALLASDLLSAEVDDAARWVKLGKTAIQPSLILLPVMLVAVSRSRSVLVTSGIVAAAAAMALQPDRAMAGMVVLGLAALVIIRLVPSSAYDIPACDQRWNRA